MFQPDTLRTLRHLQGLTQAQLAARSGLSDTAISYYETGRRAPTVKTAQKLAVALGCTLDDLTQSPQVISRDEFPTWLRDHRKRAGFTQKQLAAQIGVARSRISQWERGYDYPLAYIKPIQEALDAA